MQYDGRPDECEQQARSLSRSRPQSRGNRHYPPFHRENNPQHDNASGSNDNKRKNFPRKPFMGFMRLADIAKSEPKETLAKLTESRNAFIELIQFPIERFDVFAVVLQIIAKVCQSSFDQTKSKLLVDICNSNFIVSFTSYLMQLPYALSKSSNNLYWNDQEAFWRNFVDFCEYIVNTSPTLALIKCRPLLEASSIACLDGLKDRHGFVLPEECSVKLVELRERMTNFEKKTVVCKLCNFFFIFFVGSKRSMNLTAVLFPPLTVLICKFKDFRDGYELRSIRD